jgi:archaellum component FlaF (FlaF/FlaG flagellin family)
LLQTQSSRHNKEQEEKGGVSKVNGSLQKRDNLVRYSGNQLDASNPERMKGKKREMPKKKKISVLKSAILEERALRRNLRVTQEQAQNVHMKSESSQKHADVTVNNSSHEISVDSSVKQIAQGTFISENMESEKLCVSQTVSFEEATGDNINKVKDLNSTEILDLTYYVQEKLSLSTNDEARMLSRNMSHVPENAQEMIMKTEAQEDNCTEVLSGSPKHDCTDVFQRFSVHSRKFRE